MNESALGVGVILEFDSFDDFWEGEDGWGVVDGFEVDGGLEDFEVFFVVFFSKKYVSTGDFDEVGWDVEIWYDVVLVADEAVCHEAVSEMK